ncbi:hypothetical protein K1T71_002382 [Dendrolimus kikuchii]|uniref:Uncharacterized protein n=1 Tax=Dendrolimus kikuchii TaxID=765133 RepID=A0ACC1DCV8_9NEOP|nr:hypothetical protein K1T71_002382 [Dendrolimus kikuchii]
MTSNSATIPLEDGLDLRQIIKGSLLKINLDYDETEQEDSEQAKIKITDFIGKPIPNFSDLESKMTAVDTDKFVKKKIVEEGGGLPISDEFTVCIAFSGYWEGQKEAFDMRSVAKPLVINMKEHGLLPGLEIAIKSMLVGEVSIFLLSYKVMYGELGLPPRIKPKQDCVFYIKLIKSTYTPKNGDINFKEPNMFERVHHEVCLLMSSGLAMHKSKNTPVAANLFKRAVAMLHKCRLADENEEKRQEKLLIKLYLNLAICYNDINQPLKACTACNELNRLNSLWNNHRALFQNAKALRMISQFDSAEKRLKRAMKLSPESVKIKAEFELLNNTKESIKNNRLASNKFISTNHETISQAFKDEVDKLLKSFKENVSVCRLTLSPNLNTDELKYIKGACIRENLYVSNNNNSKNSYGTSDAVSNEQYTKFFLDKSEVFGNDIYNEDFSDEALNEGIYP